MLEVAAALETVLSHTRPPPPVRLPLGYGLLGLRLAEAVTADGDSPPFDKALMDGYAVRSADRGPRNIVGELAAGDVPLREIQPNEAMRIFTGAMMPGGADAVAMQEDCGREGDTVTIGDKPLSAGRNVMPRGADLRRGETVIAAGTILNAAHLGLLAAVGGSQPTVFPRPQVGVLATGNELVNVAVEPAGGQIRNSNGPMLCGQVARVGGNPTDFGIAPDDEAQMKNRIRIALESSDILLLAGGVSVGDFDFVPKVLTSLGVETHFHTVRMKPGKPLLFGTLGEKLVFGLPGNPGSAFTAFELFVAPALRHWLGDPDPGPRIETKSLAVELKANHDRPTYHPATVLGESVAVRPWAGSASLHSLADVNGFIVMPVGLVDYSRGDSVLTLIID